MIDVALVVLAVTFAATTVRIALGPTEADRAVAADLAFFVVIAAVALLAVRLDQDAFLDAVLVATFVGFLASITLARLMDRDR